MQIFLVTRKATTGSTNTPIRTNQVITLMDRCRCVATMSLPPPMSSTAYRVSQATPRPVRTGALRGRSRMWCSRLSPVIHASMKG